MDVEITPATTKDAKRALLYYKDILEEKLPFILNNPVPTIEQEIKFIQDHNTNHSLLLLAEVNGTVVGICGYTIATHHQLIHTCSMNISVAKSFRRNGIGSILIADGERWCMSKSVHRLELEMIAGNPAITFYQKLGFEVEGRKRNAIKVENELRDLVIMAKLLA